MFWYHIKEVSENVNCKGCLADFKLPVESKFSYKMNDLIKNNIFQTKRQRDGNLTVIRTLAYIFSSSYQFFAYSPQINLFIDHYSKKPIAEIDVLCITDGKLLIGEAKHSSPAFFDEKNKSLDSLIEVAKAISPDQILLSCYEDENNKLNNAQKYLERHFKNDPYPPEILTILLEQPSDFSLGGHRYFYYQQKKSSASFH